MKLAVTSALLICLLCSSALEAAAPRLLIVYGKPLQKPVLLDDAREIFKMFTSTPTETGVNLNDRPFLELGMFWGPQWNDYINDGNPPDKLQPEDANQHGRLYPAFGDSPAFISFGSTGKPIPAESLKFLEHSGIPARLP
jgi:hypothetical protein